MLFPRYAVKPTGRRRGRPVGFPLILPRRSLIPGSGASAHIKPVTRSYRTIRGVTNMISSFFESATL